MPTIYVSSVIDAPVEEVWAHIRDFNGLPGWHPRMVESEIEDGLKATDVGAVRKFKVASGATIREKLLAFSDRDHSTTYSIIGHPAPISNHTATLKALIDAGTDVNIADRQGVTPLQHARRRGYVNMVRILEAAGGR